MIEEIIKANKSNFTTLNTFLVMLHGYIEQLESGVTYTGMASTEVLAIYNNYKKITGGIKNYYESYLQRKTNDRGYYYESGDKYFLKTKIVENKSIEVLKDFRTKILKILTDLQHSNDEFIESMQIVCDNEDAVECYNFILGQFDNKSVKNFGQLYEILSFSILKVYFENFGFNLNRFSTSFSNDGGMDFISFAGIYQVTAVASKNKAQDDLLKLPDTKRVIVLNECSINLIEVYKSDKNVTEVVIAEDLKNHFLEWLRKKHTSTNNHLIKVMKVFNNEWKREFTLNY